MFQNLLEKESSPPTYGNCWGITTGNGDGEHRTTLRTSSLFIRSPRSAPQMAERVHVLPNYAQINGQQIGSRDKWHIYDGKAVWIGKVPQ